MKLITVMMQDIGADAGLVLVKFGSFLDEFVLGQGIVAECRHLRLDVRHGIAALGLNQNKRVVNLVEGIYWSARL